MLHMQQILPKGKCSHFYRDLVEMPHEFARRESTRSQLLPKKWCNMG